MAAANWGSLSSPLRPIRLAILENDVLQPQSAEKFGTYGSIFTSLLEQACKTFHPPQDLEQQLHVTSYNVVNGKEPYPALDDVDALLLTGSRHTAFENDSWILNLVDFTKQALNSGRIKLIGVCFGHQIIGRAAGAGLGRSETGWEVAVTEVNLTDKGKDLFGMAKMRIQQMHRDVIQDCPADAIILGSNRICEVQSMFSPRKYLTVQGHPEFTEEIVSEILVNRHNAGIFNAEIFEDAMKRASIEHDGVAIARTFLKFLREE